MSCSSYMILPSFLSDASFFGASRCGNANAKAPPPLPVSLQPYIIPSCPHNRTRLGKRANRPAKINFRAREERTTGSDDYLSYLLEIRLPKAMDHEADLVSLSNVQRYCLEVLQEPTSSILPDTLALTRSRENLQDLPSEGWGIARTTEHLIRDVAPGLNQSSLSPRYYGFVTGGVTPGARIGECLVSSFDQNAQVHLPDETVATNVDAKAIDMLLDFFRLDVVGWSGLFTTGATASNILGLGVARECVINKAVERVVGESGVKLTVGEHGILHACQVAGVHNVTTLTTKPHSSLRKAASIVGLGRGSVLDVAKHNNGLVFDLEKLESIMIENAHTSVFIVVVSCGEVNTGLFATNGFESMQDLRTLCDRYGAWLHVDAGKTEARPS